MKELSTNKFTTDSLVIELEQTIRYLFFTKSNKLTISK